MPTPADTEAADDLRTFVYDRTGIMLSMEGIVERFARHRLAERARIVGKLKATANEFRAALKNHESPTMDTACVACAEAFDSFVRQLESDGE